MSKNVKYGILFVSIILACLAVMFFSRFSCEKVEAQIIIDGKIFKNISDIDTKDEQVVKIDNEYGYNEIHYSKGEIWVEKSDCSNQTCVHFGKISAAGQSIICAPHKLVVKLVGGSSESADVVMEGV